MLCMCKPECDGKISEMFCMYKFDCAEDLWKIMAIESTLWSLCYVDDGEIDELLRQLIQLCGSSSCVWWKNLMKWVILHMMSLCHEFVSLSYGSLPFTWWGYSMAIGLTYWAKVWRLEPVLGGYVSTYWILQDLSRRRRLDLVGSCWIL